MLVKAKTVVIYVFFLAMASSLAFHCNNL